MPNLENFGMPTLPNVARRPGVPAVRAFTLIELLIVVSIISILASIAVPNFLEAQTRAKVARMKADMRTVATGLESYMVDWGKYPPRQIYPNLGPSFRLGLGNSQTRAEDLSAITTPISYLSKIPIDVFETKIDHPNNIIDYWSPDIVETLSTSYSNWLLVSVGPDSELSEYGNWGNLPYTSEFKARFWLDYDPTNGTISIGNLFRGAGIESGRQVIDRF